MKPRPRRAAPKRATEEAASGAVAVKAERPKSEALLFWFVEARYSGELIGLSTKPVMATLPKGLVIIQTPEPAALAGDTRVTVARPLL